MKSIIYQCGSEKSRIYEIVRLNGRFDLLLPSFFIFDYFIDLF